MKQTLICLVIFLSNLVQLNAQNNKQHLFLDIHRLPEGKVKFEDVAAAHAKDLAVQKKYGVQCLRYWVDEKNGMVFCLAKATDSNQVRATHREAHGLMPEQILLVTEGKAAEPVKGKPFFIDMHQMGAGKVTAKDVAAAHEKDLAVQKKHGVHCINYWVNEQTGTILCLSQAADASAMVATHREAHGLLPMYIAEVKQGQ